MITTFIFDADGVVIDSETLYDQAMTEFLARRGFVYDREILRPLLSGRGMQNVIDQFRNYYGNFPGNDHDLIQEFIELASVLFRKDLKYFPGFLKFYEQIKADYKTAIASGSSPKLLKIADERLNLFELFDQKIYTSSGLNILPKPEPDLFLYVAEKLDSRPEACVVIEDAPAGLESARRAGMKSIGLAGTHSSDHLAQADIIIDSYAEIELNELNNL